MNLIAKALCLIAVPTLLIGAKGADEKIVDFGSEPETALFVVVHPAELSDEMLEFHFREYNAVENKFESIRMGRNGAYGLSGMRRRDLDIPELEARGYTATAHLVPASLRVPAIIRANFIDSNGFKDLYVHCFRDSTPVYDFKAGRAYYMEMFDSENLDRRRQGVETGITRGGKLATVDVRRTTLYDATFDDQFNSELFNIVAAHVARVNGAVALEMAVPKYRLSLKGEVGRITEFATHSGCSNVKPDRVLD